MWLLEIRISGTLLTNRNNSDEAASGYRDECRQDCARVVLGAEFDGIVLTEAAKHIKHQP